MTTFSSFFDTQAGSCLMLQQFKPEPVNVQMLCSAKAGQIHIIRYHKNGSSQTGGHLLYSRLLICCDKG